MLPSQCSLFLSAQQVMEFFKLIEHLNASLMITSAHCSVEKYRNLPYFSLHFMNTDNFALTFL